jgi:hypothetical protein
MNTDTGQIRSMESLIKQYGPDHIPPAWVEVSEPVARAAVAADIEGIVERMKAIEADAASKGDDR